MTKNSKKLYNCSRLRKHSKIRLGWDVGKTPPPSRRTQINLASQVVNLLIGTPPIWAVMKFFAKIAIKSTAEKRGIEWDGYARRVLAQQPEVRAAVAALTPDAVWAMGRAGRRATLGCGAERAAQWARLLWELGDEQAGWLDAAAAGEGLPARERGWMYQAA